MLAGTVMMDTFPELTAHTKPNSSEKVHKTIRRDEDHSI
jgi:hypothetical protein